MPEHDDTDDKQTQDTGAMKQLRQAHERAKAGEEKWRRIALKGLAQQAGLDPKAKVTDLLVKEFETQLGDDDPDVDSFSSFAQEYGVTPNAPGEKEEEVTDDKTEQLNRFQKEVDDVGRDVTTHEPGQETPVERANKRLAEGDVRGSISEKFGALRAASETQE